MLWFIIIKYGLWEVHIINSNNFSYNDIWNSQDGLNWTKVKDNNDKGWKKRADFGALVMDSKIWIVGGRYNYSRLYNDVW